MRYSIIVTFIILGPTTVGLSQTVNDFVPKKEVSISGVTLCRTTLTDIQSLAKDFKLVSVEEMDLPKNCYGQDGRYTSGEGYSSALYPGLIFQKGNQSDYVGKIRLTKDFQGKLPNGSIIDMKTLKLRDVFMMYPEFKDKWDSRTCSNYWHFSNDTISFYVKIDKTIQPQFPINEMYYYDKSIDGIDLVLSCYGLLNKTVNVFKEPEHAPIFFIDSIRVNSNVLSWYDRKEIASITVIKDNTVTRTLGEEGKNGLVYIYTKNYIKSSYWNYLTSISKDYLKVVPSIDKEKYVVYILNNTVLQENFEGELFELNDNKLLDLQVIDKKTLKKDFKIKNKDWGILITTTSNKAK